MTFGLVHIQVQDQAPIVVAGDAYQLGRDIAARTLIAPVHKVLAELPPEQHHAFVCGVAALVGGLGVAAVGRMPAARIFSVTAEAIATAEGGQG